tara:strand:+ start:11734 stop:12036 length:303 start_codon:yes stop_codon:yes gene_type:complete
MAGNYNTKSEAGTFTGTGAGASIEIWGNFNISLSALGTNVVSLQRSFDNGTSWVDVASYDGASDGASIQRIVTEVEKGVLYRFNCTTYNSGTVVWRISAA